MLGSINRTLLRSLFTVADYDCDSKEFQDIDRSEAGSTMHAFFNVVCVIAGTGTLGLPYALRLGGWIGILILFLAWFMSTYTSIILVRCLYASGNKRLLSYKDVATAAYGALGGWVTFFFNAWILVGAPVLYMVLCGSNFQFLCKGTAGAIGEIPWTIICSVLVAIPFVFVKSLKEVGLMAGFGAFATFATVLIVLIVACIDQKNLTDIHHDSVIWDQFPIALSTISFSFGGNVVLPHVEASMNRPRDFNKVAAAGMAACAGMYFLTAIPGYYIYGRNVVSPVYDSIPSGVPRIIAIVLMTVHVLFAAPILLTSFALDVEEMLNIKVERLGRVKEFCIRCCLRLLLMACVTVLACTVPHFDLLMSLIGSFANCGLIFIFPVLFYWRLTGFRNKPIYELAFCGLIILLGIVGLIFGTIDSIRGLVNAY
ncbi:transmembrane amino acid transporter protein-domain-containing protein [Dichotomocladium elegans]|nr:transmembrane amino acid transporter protein-domain-containing protein [Dichotomocladium elegans]